MSTGTVSLDTKTIETALAVVKQTAETIAVTDSASCLAAKTAQRDVRNYMKDVHLKLDPFIESAKRNLQEVRDELNKWLIPAEAIDSALAQKVKDFERREREAAEVEQRRINEERRLKTEADAKAEREAREKQAKIEREAREKEIEAARKAGEIKKREADRLAKEAREAEERERERAKRDEVVQTANVQEVKVAPSIPTVAGVPSRRNYKARVIDASRVPDRFWIIDEQALGAEARRVKKVGEIIPGVEFYED